MDRMRKMEEIRDTQMMADMDKLESVKEKKSEKEQCAEACDKMMEEGGRCCDDDEPMDKRRESDARNREM